MMKKRVFTAMLTAVAMSCSSQGGVGGDVERDVARVLKENPDILIEALKKRKVELFEVVQDGASEKRSKAESDQRKSEQQNPVKPLIDDKRISRWNSAAPVTIVEYSDFECPFCARSHKTLEQLTHDNKGKLKLIYKHNPLPMHKNALPASMYFEAIAMQDHEAAWRFHDEIFEDQSILKKGEDGLKKLASSLNVDMNRLASDLKDPAIKKRIEQDMAEANKFGFNGTPTFVINGISIRGAYPAENFQKLIDLALDK